MKICGIISEYNPFHFGHKFQIQKTREILGKDTIFIAIMSGNFVQRGDFAIMHKSERAKIAILSGIDIVLELPINIAISSAENFAKRAIDILNKIGITHLSFGSECGDISKLKAIAEIIKKDDFLEKVKLDMKNGTSFPKSRAKILSEISKDYNAIISSPNNILAIEYLKAIPENIVPITIKREIAQHDTDIIIDNFTSASNIRNIIKNGEKFEDFITYNDIFIQEIEKGKAPVFMENIENTILGHFKRLEIKDLEKIADCTDGLASRIFSAIKKSTTLDGLYNEINTKRYTKSRIRRILISAFLGIEKDLKHEYIRVLAFNDNGQTILRNKNIKIPLITRYKDFGKLEDGKFFKIDALAEDLYALAYPNINTRISGDFYRISAKKIKQV